MNKKKYLAELTVNFENDFAGFDRECETQSPHNLFKKNFYQDLK